jgi:hypothetical protein
VPEGAALDHDEIAGLQVLYPRGTERHHAPVAFLYCSDS